MEAFKLADFVGGWFVGGFLPTVTRTDEMEVAVKYYQAGDREAAHHHKLAEEITLVAAGCVRMSGRQLCSGDIVRIRPGESTDFEALSETITVVVKRPSVAGDKYFD
jgi:hypothetical protein